MSVTLANLSTDLVGPTKSYDMFKDINLTMTRHTNLVIDSWGARGPGQVMDKLDNVVVYPASQLGVLRALTHVGVAFMESPRYLPGVCLNCGPKIGQLDYWSDDVPNDRLR